MPFPADSASGSQSHVRWRRTLDPDSRRGGFGPRCLDPGADSQSAGRPADTTRSHLHRDLARSRRRPTGRGRVPVDVSGNGRRARRRDDAPHATTAPLHPTSRGVGPAPWDGPRITNRPLLVGRPTRVRFPGPLPQRTRTLLDRSRRYSRSRVDTRRNAGFWSRLRSQNARSVQRS